MRERLRERLLELRAEQQAGERLVADLDRKRTDLETTLLRIGGAIQVLEELLAAEDPADGPAPEPADGSTAESPPPRGDAPETAPAGNGQVGVPV